MTRALPLLLCWAATAHGHGSLVFPPPRNNFKNQNPAVIVHPWTEGRRLGGPCAGSACPWFNEGCFSGCSTCATRGKVIKKHSERTSPLLTPNP